MDSNVLEYIDVFSKHINTLFKNSNFIENIALESDNLVHFAISFSVLNVDKKQKEFIIQLLLENRNKFFKKNHSLFKGIPLLSLILLINKDILNINYYKQQKELLYLINKMDINVLDFKGIEYINGLTGLLNYYLILKFYENSLYTKQSNDKSHEIILALIDYVNNEMYHLPSINLGLSHGISGILAVLSKSYKLGFRINGLLECIIVLQKQLINQFITYGIRIPSIVGSSITFARISPSWCYSELGILHALIKSYDALGNVVMSVYYKQKIKNIILDTNNYKIISPNFCHGYSGILAFYKYYKLKNETVSLYLLTKIKSFYDKNCKSYFYDQYYNQVNQICVENTFSFLDGSISVLLALLFFEEYDLSIWKSMMFLD